MSKNLVQDYISTYFDCHFNNENAYSNSIVEYINHVVEDNELTLHHIHIDDFLDEDEQANVIDRIIDYFHDYYCLNIEDESDFNAGAIISDITNKLKNNSTLRNPTVKEREKVQKNKHYLKIKRSVMKDSYIENQPILPKVIFNFNVNTLSFYSNNADKELRQLFKSRGWNRMKIPAEEIDEKESLLRSFKYTVLDDITNINQNNASYITLNKQQITENDNIKIADTEVSFLYNIESIVFFNNYTKEGFKSFLLNNLEVLNRDAKTKFKQVFSISFNSRITKTTIWNLIQKKENIRNSITGDLKDNFQKHIALNKDYLLSSWPKVDFFGPKTNQFWVSFRDIARLNGLNELVSIKFRDIYSICLSENIKDFILSSIFNETKSDIISSETFQLLNELDGKTIDSLKTELQLFLNLITESDYLSELKNLLCPSNSNRAEFGILISQSIAKNPSLRTEISNLLSVPERNIKTWYSNSFGSKEYIILAYRDIGSYKYNFYPNLFESGKILVKKAFLFNFLYSDYYNTACYQYNKEHAKLLSNSLLNDKYNWQELINKIEQSKPIISTPIYEDELNYSNSENLTQYRVKFEGSSRELRIEPSDKIIICNESDYELLGVQNFFDQYLEDLDVVIIQLGNLVDELELPEIDYNRKEITEQLAFIKIDFGIEDMDTIENGGRLWKILLKRRREAANDDDGFYSEIMKLLQNIGINVSSNTFFNVWCNPDSDTIRTNLKALQKICKYFELPNSYFELVRRYSSDTASVATQSTRIHNELITNLINSGIFKSSIDNYDVVIAQIILDFSIDFLQDLELIGFSKNDLAEKLRKVVIKTENIIIKNKNKVEELIINTPFDE